MIALSGPRQLTFLACLLLHPNQPISTDRLNDLMWGGGSAGSRTRLPMAVARLRQALALPGPRHGLTLRTVQGGYLLSVDSDELDASMFASRLRDAQRALRSGDPAQCRSLVLSALSLWRGTALADVRYHDFAQLEIRRLDELHLVAQETRFDAELRLGRHHEVVCELTALAVEHPTRERLAAQVMVALYRCGRQADALRSYQAIHEHLDSQFGLVPGPALTDLQRQILNHDPVLLAAA